MPRARRQTSSSKTSTATTAKKRKLPSTWDEDDKSGANAEASKSQDAPKKPRRKANEEKRLRMFRKKAPVSFEVIYQRATEQRFYVLSRVRCGDPWCPEEEIELTGSTGNIYHVHIAKVMSRVLRARHELVYQLALLSTELREIFMLAPDIEISEEESGSNSHPHDPNRKAIEGDCPICFAPFEGDPEDTVVYCRATCGQNIHKECFEMWAATKRQNARDAVTCPMCRSPWQGDEEMVKKIKNTGIPGPDGYVNVADQLGISRIQDSSTYYSGPRRGERASDFSSWHYRPRYR